MDTSILSTFITLILIIVVAIKVIMDNTLTGTISKAMYSGFFVGSLLGYYLFDSVNLVLVGMLVGIGIGQKIK